MKKNVLALSIAAALATLSGGAHATLLDIDPISIVHGGGSGGITAMSVQEVANATLQRPTLEQSATSGMVGGTTQMLWRPQPTLRRVVLNL